MCSRDGLLERAGSDFVRSIGAEVDPIGVDEQPRNAVRLLYVPPGFLPERAA